MKNLMDWLKLTRIPAVFTLIADVLAALWIADAARVTPLGALVLAGCGSAALYLAGMIFNDVFDYAEDSRLRPERPLPSGRIGWKTARNAAWTLFLAGLASVVGSSFYAQNQPAVLSCLAGLGGAILLYDGVLKNRWCGPILMGLCRGLNWLMLLNFAPVGESSQFILIPIVITVYITGMTFYSRCETESDAEAGVRRPGLFGLRLAVALMAGAFGILTLFRNFYVRILLEQPWRWTILVVFLGTLLSFRALRAYFQGPTAVRRVMKQAIFMIFFLDASLVFAVCGISYAIWIILLMAPAMISGRWIQST